MSTQILAQCAVSVSELKANPQKAVSEGQGKPVAVLNHNKAEFYCVPPELFAQLYEVLDDMDLVGLLNERLSEKRVKVDLEDL